MNHKNALAAAIAAALLLGTTSAVAAADEPKLEEMIVTAQKREQNLQDVPIAVSAISGSAMATAGVSEMKDLARHVPSLQVQSNNSPVSVNYRIRRVGNIGAIPTFEPAVGVFQDGAYRNRPLFSSGDLFDIERVEILRGPQSTLYGKNTTAGVLAIYTKKPAESFESNAEFSAGQVQGANDAALYRFVGGVSGPLTDTVGASLGLSSATQEHTDTNVLAIDHPDANNLDRQTVRGQLQWDASDALSVRLIVGAGQENDDTFLSDLYIAPGSTAAQAGAVLRRAGQSQSCASNDSQDRKDCSRLPVESDVDAREATLLADYAFDNGWTGTSITSWDWYKYKGTWDDVTQLGSPLLKLHDTQEADSWQQELRLTSAGGETIDWLGGAFWYHNEFQRGDRGKRAIFLEDTYSATPAARAVVKLAGAPIPLPFATPGQNGLLDARQDTDYLGIFGQATWNITDAFSITSGLRWQTEQKDASIEQSVTAPGLSLISLLLLPSNVGGDMHRSTDDVTWSITPAYAVSDNTNLFATVAHGFKSGGFNVGWGRTPLNQREFKDEDIMHYETGMKSTLLEGQMQVAVSAFYTEYQDYQDAAFVSQQFTVGNAQKTELKGAEADATVLLGEHVTADLGVSFADLTYEKYTNGVCYPGRTPDGTTAGTCDLSGEHPINAPEWTTHLGLMYETDVSWGDVYTRVDWAWSDSYNTSFSADPRLTQDAYNWVTWRVGTHIGDYELVAWVDNVTDEDVVNFDPQLTLFNSDPSYQTFMQAPRSFGLTARAAF